MTPQDSRDLPPKGGSDERGEAGSHAEFAVTAGLRAVAEDDERLGTSSAVGLRLLAEVQAIADAKRRRTLVLTLSAAAAMLIAVAIPTWRSLQSVGNRSPQVDAPVVSRELVTEFFPLTYGNVPTRGGYVVRMQVPRSALASFGAALAADADRASPTVLADVVIGDDGLARAVRFVQVIKQEQRP